MLRFNLRTTRGALAIFLRQGDKGRESPIPVLAFVIVFAVLYDGPFGFRATAARGLAFALAGLGIHLLKKVVGGFVLGLRATRPSG